VEKLVVRLGGPLPREQAQKRRPDDDADRASEHQRKQQREMRNGERDADADHDAGVECRGRHSRVRAGELCEA